MVLSKTEKVQNKIEQINCYMLQKDLPRWNGGTHLWMYLKEEGAPVQNMFKQSVFNVS